MIVGPSDLQFLSSDDKDPDEEIGTVNMSLYVMTQVEAEGRKQGIAREEPNDDPQLITPTEGRDWGTYLASLGFQLPDFGLWKKIVPLVVTSIVGFLVSVVVM